MRHVIINLDELIPASSGTHTHTQHLQPAFCTAACPGRNTHTHNTCTRTLFLHRRLIGSEHIHTQHTHTHTHTRLHRLPRSDQRDMPNRGGGHEKKKRKTKTARTLPASSPPDFCVRASCLSKTCRRETTRLACQEWGASTTKT